MKAILSLLLILSLATSVHALTANEETMDAQKLLSEQGLYYSDVDGIMGEETRAAIRRYQIRNGLEVNGELDAATMQRMGVASSGSSVVSSAPRPAIEAVDPDRNNPTPAPTTEPITEDLQALDQDFLKQEEQRKPTRVEEREQRYGVKETPAVIERSQPTPETPLNRQSTEEKIDYNTIFRGSPYSESPMVVKKDVLRRAQIALSREGFYQGGIDAIPGPGTLNALKQYQYSRRLPITSSFDTNTLASMGLLRSYPQPRKGRVVVEFNSGPRVYRGVWVD